jgi:hypothetical protein
MTASAEATIATINHVTGDNGAPIFSVPVTGSIIVLDDAGNQLLVSTESSRTSTIGKDINVRYMGNFSDFMPLICPPFYGFK